MRARVIVTDAPAAVIQAGIPFTKDILVPASRAQTGYRGYIALYDEAGGRSLAITLWADDDTETESDRDAAPRREEAARSLGAEIVSVDKYDVAVAELV